MKIFLVILFTCFITISAVLFAGAKAVAGRSMTDASLQLAGRSVLSEYDTKLLSDYGLLAFRGDEAWAEDAIVYYAEASLAPRDPFYALYRSRGEKTISQNARVEGIEVSFAGYSLLDVDNFEDQIRSAFLAQGIESLAGGYSGRGGSARGATKKEDGYGRVLRDSGVIATLPSEGYAGPLLPSLGDVRDIPKPEDFLEEGTTLAIVSEYALLLFGNHVDGARDGHFFGNEVEYLIVGKYDDAGNYNGINSVKSRLRAIRLALNAAALMADGGKMAEVEELALAIAAVSAEALYPETKAAIIAAWAAAETGNDLVLLEHGDKVAFMKTPAQWATHNIAQIWNGWTGEWRNTAPIYAADRGGQGYRDYLRLMLYALDRETKLLRMMDLMQVNLKGTYYGGFLMREHYMGFRFECVVDGEGYAYTEKY